MLHRTTRKKDIGVGNSSKTLFINLQYKNLVITDNGIRVKPVSVEFDSEKDKLEFLDVRKIQRRWKNLRKSIPEPISERLNKIQLECENFIKLQSKST